jgi:arylsulfatase A-like enzyme
MTIDLLPTLAGLAGSALPERKIDGFDILPLLRAEPGARSPHEALFFYYGSELRAVRSGRYKLVLPHRSQTLAGRPGKGGVPGKYEPADVPLALYDLVADLGETTDVAAQHADVVARLEALAERARDDLGDSLTGRTGRGVRESGRVP